MTQAAMIAQLTDDMATIRSWSQASPGVELAEIDTINVILGDGATILAPGFGGAVRVDFNAYITGAYLHEIDGNTGSVGVSVSKATYALGATPTFVTISGLSSLAIVDDRYGEELLLADWIRDIARGDVLRFVVTTAVTLRRVLVALRIRRLEP
jgi:hypothetical protein